MTLPCTPCLIGISSLKVSDESLGRDETYVCKASHIIIHSKNVISYNVDVVRKLKCEVCCTYTFTFDLGKLPFLALIKMANKTFRSLVFYHRSPMMYINT